MIKKTEEIDFIGGEGPLTVQEEQALSNYFAAKKTKKVKNDGSTKLKGRRAQKIHLEQK